MIKGTLGAKPEAQGEWIYAGTNAKGEPEYHWLDTKGRSHVFTEQDMRDAGFVANALKHDRDARKKSEESEWLNPKDRIAAGGIDKKPLPSEANKLRPKTRKAPVDRYGWPVKVESEKKTKKDKTKEVVQKIPEPGTGFLLPSVVVGGYSPHAQAPSVWDVAIYKTAHLDGSFVNFKLPPIEPLKEHLKRLQKELLRLGEDDDLEESPTCALTQFGPAKKLMADQAAAGVHYHISARATCSPAGFDALKAALLIGPDGEQNTSSYEGKKADVRSFTWAGPMQGPANINDVNLVIPPHIMVEDGDPAAGARALILRHDGQPAQLIPKSTSYSLEPDVIPHPKFTFMQPYETPVADLQIVLDLDFFVLGGGRWELVIVRHV